VEKWDNHCDCQDRQLRQAERKDRPGRAEKDKHESLSRIFRVTGQAGLTTWQDREARQAGRTGTTIIGMGSTSRRYTTVMKG
jgi:hypothetical protein